MFEDATSFNQPLNKWNVSKVTDMNWMFYGANSFNQPLNDWNVSNVTSMNEMFCCAYSFNQPLTTRRDSEKFKLSFDAESRTFCGDLQAVQQLLLP